MDDVGVRRAVHVARGPAGPRRDDRVRSGESAALVAFAEGTSARLGWQLDYRAGPAAHYAAVVDATDRRGPLPRQPREVRRQRRAGLGAVPGRAARRRGAYRDLTPYLSPGATDLSGPYAHAWSDTNDNDFARRRATATSSRSTSPTPARRSAAPARAAASSSRSPSSRRASRGRGATPPTSAPGTSAPRRAGRPTARRTRCRPSTTSTASATTCSPRRSRSPRPTATSTTATACSSTPTTARATGARRPGQQPLDNAYMDTPPDGTSPTMAMFLFFDGHATARSATSTAATTPRSSTTSTRTASAAGS